jgi:hypothetical protein
MFLTQALILITDLMLEYFDLQIDDPMSIEFMLDRLWGKLDRLSGKIDLLRENRARAIVADRQYCYN